MSSDVMDLLMLLQNYHDVYELLVVNHCPSYKDELEKLDMFGDL